MSLEQSQDFTDWFSGTTGTQTDNALGKRVNATTYTTSMICWQQFTRQRRKAFIGCRTDTDEEQAWPLSSGNREVETMFEWVPGVLFSWGNGTWDACCFQACGLTALIAPLIRRCRLLCLFFFFFLWVLWFRSSEARLGNSENLCNLQNSLWTLLRCTILFFYWLKNVRIKAISKQASIVNCFSDAIHSFTN